jgi:FKBP-type peptidyl-prolyl cis-trans isomerase FkpA
MKKTRIAAVIAAGLVLSACGKEQSEPVAAPVEEAPACTTQTVSDVQAVEITPGLTSRISSTGCGDVAAAGQFAVVHYTGWLSDSEAENRRGEKFDSSRDRDQPFRFALGAGKVIKGWDQGVVGMTIGEVRELTIAPEMAYGDRADIGVIPPGSTLIFEVELVALEGTQPAASD